MRQNPIRRVPLFNIEQVSKINIQSKKKETKLCPFFIQLIGMERDAKFSPDGNSRDNIHIMADISLSKIMHDVSLSSSHLTIRKLYKRTA